MLLGSKDYYQSPIPKVHFSSKFNKGVKAEFRNITFSLLEFVREMPKNQNYDFAEQTQKCKSIIRGKRYKSLL